MRYKLCVELSNNINELKRIASAYVEDSRRLDLSELKASLIKTEEQYSSSNNIARKICELNLHEVPAVRTIVPIILRECLIEADEYMLPCKITDEMVLSY